MDAKENALRIISFDNPERITTSPPLYTLYYHGCNHEGFEEGKYGDGSPVGTECQVFGN